MKIIKEFKEFAIKGNMIDMAVGIIIGGAFGKIIASLVKDVIMPPLAMLTGGVDFSDKKLVLKQAIEAADGVAAVEAVSLNYGLFVNQVVDFLIVAFAVFMMIKAINKAKRKQEAAPPPAPPAPTAQEVLLTEIRDLLKNK
jgi:large conductance mechanosensitive channel